MNYSRFIRIFTSMGCIISSKRINKYKRSNQNTFSQDSKQQYHNNQMFKTLQTIYNHPKWETKIEPTLRKISNKEIEPGSILMELIKFKTMTWTQRTSSNHTKQEMANCLALKKLYKNEIQNIYSQIAKFILLKHQVKIPIIYSGINQEIILSKTDILLMLCMMSTFLVPTQFYHKQRQYQPNFSRLKDFGCIFGSQEYKTQCIIEYLKQQLKNYQKTKDQKFIIKRLVTKQNIEDIINKCGQQKMVKIQIQSDTKSIQEYHGSVKIDFANKFIGGGSLSHGCVQEQIMFANRPQLYTTQLLCEKMKSNEALFFIGFRKYFKNTGYGWSTAYNGFEQDNFQRFKSAQLQGYFVQEYISAIDALHYGKKGDLEQFQEKAIERELLKAYSGFSYSEKLPIITGNWGCGAFNGDHQLKFLIQWLAASLNKKKLIYCPYGFKNIVDDKKIIQYLQTKNIKEVYDIIIQAGKKVKENKTKIYQNIYKLMK